MPLFAVFPLVCVGLLVCLAGCYPGIMVEPVPTRSAPPFPEESVLAPITFERGSVYIRRGTLVGTYRDGLLCANGGEKLYWTVSSDSRRWLDIAHAELFHEQFSAAGYTVIGDPKKLFEGRIGNAPKPVYRISAQVEDIRLNLCDKIDVWYRDRLYEQIGEGKIRVHWQVFSPLDRQVILQERTEGSFSITQAQPNADMVLVAESFAQAAGNFAASPALRQLVMAPVPTHRSRLTRRVGKSLWVPFRSLSRDPIDTHIQDIRRSIVTVDAGDHHGSGFFISPTLVMTNHHVTEGIKLARIVLNTGVSFLGDVVRYDEKRDVALIRVEPMGHQPLPLRTRPARITETVYAIGTPVHQSLRGTVSRGIISRFGANKYGLPTLQADVDIHGGSSGGPLLDRFGNVIGIGFQGVSQGNTKLSSGLNFFIPIKDALKRLRLIVRHPNDTRSEADFEGG